MIATGGKPVYGATIGLVMLETEFPRIVGDTGNALTWPFPVHFRVVDGASPDRVVRQRAEGLLTPFINAAKDLVATGADAIAMNCGFLALYQEELRAACGVPMVSSSLMQIPWVQATLPPNTPIGVLTISAASLTSDHLSAAGAPLDTPIRGTDNGREFSRVILGNEHTLDVDKARADLVSQARALITDHPGLGAIILECTNMVPFAADIQRATNIPVFSMYTLVCWLQSAVAPRSWSQF